MGGDRQNRHARAVTVEQAVDQVQVAGAAASGADREVAGQMRLGAGGKGGDFFMADMQPVDAAVAAHRVGKPLRLSPTMP